MRNFLIGWAWLSFLYFAFAGKLNGQELGAAILLSALASASYAALGRDRRRNYPFEFGLMLRMPSAFPQAVCDSVRVMLSACAREVPRGRLERVRIDAKPGTASGRIRSAIEIESRTLPPNTIVADHVRGRLIIHRLLPRSLC